MTVIHENRVVVFCPVCGNEREISARQQRRIVTGIHAAMCFWCRTGKPRLSEKYHDRYLRYWLEWAGVDIGRNDPRRYVLLHGLPPKLAELAVLVWPEMGLHDAA